MKRTTVEELSGMVQLAGDVYMDNKMFKELLFLDLTRICVVFTDNTYLCISIRDGKIGTVYRIDGKERIDGLSEMSLDAVKRVMSNDKTTVAPKYLLDYEPFPWIN